MARIKDFTLTTTLAGDDYLPLDGATNGTRAILGGNLRAALGIGTGNTPLFAGMALGGNLTLSTLGAGLLRADAPSGTAAAYRLALAGVDVAQFSVSGGNAFWDYPGTLSFRSGFGGAVRATLDASGNLTVNGVGGHTFNGALQVTGAAVPTTSSGGLTLRSGIVASVPSNGTDAYIGVQNTGGPGVAAGDLLYITRTSSGINAAHRFFTETSGTPIERLSISNSGTLVAGNLTVSGTGTSGFVGDVRVMGGTDPSVGTSESRLHVTGGNPRVTLTRSASSANQRVFDMIGQADGIVRFRFVNDAASTAASQISVTGNSASAISTEIHGNLTVSGTGTHSLAGRVNTSINTPGNGFISTLRNSGGNGVLELVGTSAGPAEKAAQLFADGSGNFTLYTNATPGTLGTPALTVGPGGNISLLGVTALKGTTTNDNAAAGNVGEFLNATVGSGGAVSLTAGVLLSVTSLSLTPGDWDVQGAAVFTQTSGTTATDFIVGISNSTGGWDGGETSYARTGFLTSNATILTATLPAASRRISISTTTSIHLLVRGTFSGGTLTVFGNINARRVR